MIFKQAHSGNYRKGRAAKIKYIVLHYTANTGDTAQNNLDYFARVSVSDSAHYFVDESGVRQSVKDADTAYHCGAKSYLHKECRNANSIGIEMCNSVNCVPQKTMEHAAALTKELMKKYNIPVENVLRHYDVTGKACPLPWSKDEKAWTAFRSMIDTMTMQEAKEIVQKKAGLNDATMAYLQNYKFGKDLLIKLAKAMR